VRLQADGLNLDKLQQNQAIKRKINLDLFFSSPGIITMGGVLEQAQMSRGGIETTTQSFTKSKDEPIVLVIGFGACLSFLSAYEYDISLWHINPEIALPK
jgi:UDP-N-acetylmuramoylalanine-D-glutamate ligase